MAGPRRLAVLDTSVIILVCTERVDDSPKEEEGERRRRAALSWLTYLGPDVRFAVPTPVLAELWKPRSPAGFLDQLAKVAGRIRVLPLTRAAAVVAARIAEPAMRRRKAQKLAGKTTVSLASMDTLGRRLAYATAVSGLSRRELGRFAGVSESLVGMAIARDTGVASKTLGRLAEVLGVSSDWLLRGGRTPSSRRIRAAVDAARARRAASAAAGPPEAA